MVCQTPGDQEAIHHPSASAEDSVTPSLSFRYLHVSLEQSKSPGALVCHTGAVELEAPDAHV